MIDVRRITIEDLEAAPELERLLAGYADESAIPELREHSPGFQVDTYRHLEAGGILHPLGAYRDGELVGFLLLLVNGSPHWGCLLAVTESYYVAPEHRKSGAGINLLRAAEGLARELGAVALLVSAPAGGRLSAFLSGLDRFRRTNEVYFRSLA